MGEEMWSAYFGPDGKGAGSRALRLTEPMQAGGKMFNVSDIPEEYKNANAEAVKAYYEAREKHTEFFAPPGGAEVMGN